VTPGCRLLGVCLVTAGAACTPLGLWVYDDPGLEVSRVRLERDAAGKQPIVVGLAVWNPNDYDLSTARLELRLRLDDVPMGYFSKDSIIRVAQLGFTVLALPLTVPTGPTRARIRTLSSGIHRFAVEGRATFETPFGRRNVRFAHAGDLAFGGSKVAVDASVTDSSSAHRDPPPPQLPAVLPRREEGAQARGRRQQQ
jgi:LEA14-like dessication related protein